MKYVIGALALTAIVIFILTRESGPPTSPTPDLRNDKKELQPADARIQNATSSQAKAMSAPPPKDATVSPSLEGIVTSVEDGRPLSDIVIFVCREDKRKLVDARTSEEGKYTMCGLAPGLYGVCVQGDDYDGEGSVVVVPGRTARRDLQVTARSAIRGTVRDREGRPISLATVYVDSQLGSMTDENGDYEFKISGQYHLVTARARLYTEERKWIEGRPSRVDFVLQPEKRGEIEIFGTVRDSDGAPMPDIGVDINPRGFDWEVIPAKSDATGAYSVRAVIQGESDCLAIASEEYSREIPLPDGNNHIRHDITLPWNMGAVTTVTGRAVDAVSGKSIANGVIVGTPNVFALPGKDSLEETVSIDIRGEKRHEEVNFSAKDYSTFQTTVFHDPSHPRTIDLGEIRLFPAATLEISTRDVAGTDVQVAINVASQDGDVSKAMAIHRYTITAPSKQFRVKIAVDDAAYEPYEETADLEAGSQKSLEIVLKRRTRRTYAILATDSAGKPVAEAVINYAPNGTAVTDTAGTAKIATFPVSGTIVANGYLSRSFDLPENQESITVVLEAPGTITGRVVTEDGNPLPGASVFCESQVRINVLSGPIFAIGEGSIPTGTTDAQGRFVLQRLSPGTTYKLSAKHPYYDFRSEVQIRRPDASDIVLTVKKTVYGEIVIQFAGEDPPEGTLVSCEWSAATTKICWLERAAIVRDRAIRLKKMYPFRGQAATL